MNPALRWLLVPIDKQVLGDRILLGTMTLCAYLSPQEVDTGIVPFPVIITDCLVTFKGKIEDNITPSNVNQINSSVSSHIANLSTKYFLLDDNNVVTFAGGLNEIREFMQHFPNFFSRRHDRTRPMRYAGDTVEEFNRTWNGPDIACLGCGVVHNDGKTLLNPIALKNETFWIKTNNFGRCNAIGSGAKEFIKWLKIYDQSVTKYHTIQSKNNKLALAVGLVGALNSRKLFFKEDDRVSKTWGGILQAISYEEGFGGWFHMGSWLYIAIKIFDIRPLNFSYHNKFVLYRPGENLMDSSRLAAVVLDEKQHALVLNWIMESPFIESVAKVSNDSVWISNFQPMHVTILFDMSNVSECQFGHFHRTLTPVEAKDVTWKFGSGKQLLTVPENIIQKIVDESVTA